MAAFRTCAAILSIWSGSDRLGLRRESVVPQQPGAQVGEKDGGKLELLKVLSAHTQVLPASAPLAHAAGGDQPAQWVLTA